MGLGESFKIIAIRPQFNCSKVFLKNLQEGEIYQFYNDYHFKFEYREDSERKIVKGISYVPSIPEEMYTPKGEMPWINVSGIVGKNGAGKSSLLELLYIACFSIAFRKDLIFDERKKLLKNFHSTKDFLYSEMITELDETIEGLKVDLFISRGKDIYCISIDGAFSYLKDFQDNTEELPALELSEFFYTIVSNYSIYGLNSRYNKIWLDPLIRKNDGYQVPIVFNPYRTEGIIDINVENHLARTRLISNLILQDREKKNITSDKSISSINFILDPENVRTLGIHSIFLLATLHEKALGESISSLVKTVLKELVGFELDLSTEKRLEKRFEQDFKFYKEKKECPISSTLNFKPDEQIPNYEDLLYYSFLYCFRKILKICIKYPEYHKFIETPNEKGEYVLKNVPGLLRRIKTDLSHITLKLYQILYIIKNGYLKQEWRIKRNEVKRKQKVYLLKIDFKDLENKILSAAEGENTESLEPLVPLALFQMDILLEKKGIKGKIHFSTLSSGEQQFIFNIHGIIYHLNNLNSVFKDKSSKRLKYSNINLVLDEIELYFHPEFQQKFVFELISNIQKLKIDRIKGINILMSTHSPFILSDIPRNNILKLRDGKPELAEDEPETFGANIHELLTDSFFLGDGLMGEFAQREIRRLIEDVNSVDSINTELYKQRFEKRVNIIGEPFLKAKILDMIAAKSTVGVIDTILDLNIDRLRQLKKKRRDVKD